ncbi:hypothetical protein HG536_0C04010 [Torulaspora globosa]|uniref:Transcriptional regulatory protein n=1 Tax=Torulaspora globosa TaxID=48254 RepID=A0A7G3ZFE6_9SACH|nr:uncharacterized protein HG536_0C04010 [Torulaspora globosa]QLL32232.1 hypothetical protein HG536_0C04010 [Torulaspora globosa]
MNRCAALRTIATRGFSTGNAVVRSGHNKWSTIKHDKAKNDAERNKLFSKFAQRISLAVKLGGSSDPSLNIRLATAIELASKNNVTKKVIENAIKKGSGASAAAKGAGNMEMCLYEGMGPEGVALVVEALTDNKNRTIGLVRSAFTKANGSMTPTLYFFDKRGYVVARPPAELQGDDDRLLEKVLELDGVQDLETADEDPTCKIVTETTATNTVAAALKQQGFEVAELGMEYAPKNDMRVSVTDQEALQRIRKFLTVLEEIEEVTDVYTNLQQT